MPRNHIKPTDGHTSITSMLGTAYDRFSGPANIPEMANSSSARYYISKIKMGK